MKKLTILIMLLSAIHLGNVKAAQIVVETQGGIQSAIDAASDNDTIILVDSIDYLFNTVVFNAKQITMMADVAATKRPWVRMKTMQLKGKNSGTIFKGIDFQADPANTGSDYFMDCQADMDSALYLKVYDCTIKNFGRSVIRANRAAYLLDTVIFSNTWVSAVDSTQDDAGYATFFFDNDCEVRYFELSNCTFDNGTYRFLDHRTATQKNILINNCTFNQVNAAFRNEDIFRLDDATGGSFTLKNSIITNIPGSTKKLFTVPAAMTDSIVNAVFFSIEQDTSNTWSHKSNFTMTDPQYADETSGDFTVGNASLLTMSTTGGIIGDPRWKPLSDDATLSDLLSDGVTVDGFSASTYLYTITLPSGTTAVPTVTATTNDLGASAVVTQAAAFSDTAKVVVTAENGSDQLIYKIKFLVALPSGMVAYWKMDDGSGTTVSDESTLSNGALFNAGNVWVDGYVGKALDITAKANNDTSVFVDIPGDEIDFTSVQSFSFSVIVKLDTTDASEQSIISKGMPNVSNGGWYHLSYKNGAGRFMVWDSTTLSSTTGTFQNSFPQNDWVHIVCVRNRATDSLEMYLNGLLWDKVPDNTDGEISNDGNLYIGTVPNFETDCRGAIDEVQIYGKALTPTEIKTLSESYGFSPIVDNTDASLSDLKVSGTTVTGFGASTLTYDVELAAGTTAVPAVTATATDDNASVALTEATALPGATTVLVTAEDGATKQMYTINFTLAKSTNANLSAITLNPSATLAPSFDASVTTYSVEMPEGTTKVNVSATLEDSTASLSGDGDVDLVSGGGASNLVVTAEDGTTQKTYTINFTVITGIKNLNMGSISIYPNPVINKLFVNTDIKYDVINIFDTNGKLVVSKTNHRERNVEIEVNHLNSGRYLIQLLQNKEIMASGTFIKN